jgi:hypothetical protein
MQSKRGSQMNVHKTGVIKKDGAKLHDWCRFDVRGRLINGEFYGSSGELVLCNRNGDLR